MLTAMHGETALQRANDEHKEGAVGEFTTTHQGKDIKVKTYTDHQGIPTASIEVSSKAEDEATAIRLKLKEEYAHEDRGMDQLTREQIIKGEGDTSALKEVDKILTSVSHEANK